MKKAVAYCRSSTVDPTENNKFSISFQEEVIRNYAQKNEFEIVNWFYDKGISSDAIDRPGLGAILAGGVTNPPITDVIVARTDTISTDAELYFTFKGMLSNQGLTLTSVTEHLTDEEKKIGSVIENTFFRIHQIEKANGKYKPVSSRNAKANMGEYAGGRAPYGYAVRNKQLVVDPEQAEVVREIFNLREEGKTYLEIMDKLNEEGRECKSGKPFSLSTVRVILKNRKTYEGYYHYKGLDNKETWVRGQHEPILKEEPDTSKGN